jgi:DNA replication protein DnaC
LQLAEHELAERANRRIERHLAEAHLPPGKTLDSFAFDAVPMISKAQVMAITAGDSWLGKGANIVRPAEERAISLPLSASR